MSSDVNTDLLEETKTSLELVQVWKVVVLNDPVNLMNYVVMVFRKIFGYGEHKHSPRIVKYLRIDIAYLSFRSSTTQEVYFYV